MPAPNWALGGALLLLTLVSTMWIGRMAWALPEERHLWWSGWRFAVPLMSILLAHEFGHYIASRLHRVPASLPYFIPMPFQAFGTLGAIILMRGRIRSAKALLDVGASGPLAGMVVAVPLMLWGLAHSQLGPRCTEHCIQEGQSLLYWACKRVVFGAMRPDQDVLLHPTALAAAAGFLVTFMNLLPWGQLDGGHVAYALLGPRHHRLAPWIAALPWAFAGLRAVELALSSLRDPASAGLSLRGIFEAPAHLAAVSSGTWWLMIGVLLLLLGRFGGRRHPPVDEPRLDPLRRAVGLFTLLLFVLLFMPTPLVEY